MQETARNIRTINYLTVRIARLFLLVSLGLGFSSFACLDPANMILIAAISILFIVRTIRGKTLPLFHDSILICLPYLWALNAVDIFKSWWDWFIPLFLIVFAWCLLASIRHKRVILESLPDGLGEGLLVAFLYLTTFSAFLKMIFPWFSIEAYRTILAGNILFFGGLPICYWATPWREGDCCGS